MKSSIIKTGTMLAGFLLAACLSTHAEVKLPAIFSDGMVMQQQTNANLWGTATPHKKVTVTTSWNGKQYAATADKNGAWKLTVATPEAGGPYTVTFDDGTQKTLNNILIGELWLCSGQSNMEMPMKGFKNQPVENANMDILHSKNPQIRLFTVKRTSTFTPQNDVIGSWKEATPTSVRDFSATAYYFGRLVNEILDVPVGLVVAAWGGSACESWNGQMGWRWMFWAMTVPAALFFVFSFILPESPRWLASSGKRESALKVFTRMGGKEYAVTELAAIEAASACQTQEGGCRQLLNPAMYKVLTIGIVMAILQQWCGINVIFNYAQEIFMAAGYGVSDVLMNIVVTGITNVIFTILAMFVVDRWGRKALTLIGSFGLAIIYSFMGAAYYFHITGIVLLIIVVMAIACYAMTLATVMWVIISEIFPNRIRGVAMSVCTFALWAACFILTYTFPMLNSGLGAAGTFWLYGLICLME